MKSSRVYLVAVDMLDPTIDLRQITQLLQTSSKIKGWWNHIPGVFLVSTDLDVGDLTDEIMKATHNARLLVMEAKPTVSEGWLPERSWKWIRRRETETA